MDFNSIELERLINITSTHYTVNVKFGLTCPAANTPGKNKVLDCPSSSYFAKANQRTSWYSHSSCLWFLDRAVF